MKDVFTRQLYVVGFRHAVAAAQIATVGHREPEVAERATLGVEEHYNDYYRTLSAARRGNAVLCPEKALSQRPGSGCAHDGQAPSAVSEYS